MRELRRDPPQASLGRRHLPHSELTPKWPARARATFRPTRLPGPKAHLVVQSQLKPDRSLDHTASSKALQPQLSRSSALAHKGKAAPPLRRPLCKPNPSARPLARPHRSRPDPSNYPFPVEPGPGAHFHIVLAAFDRQRTLNLATGRHSSAVTVPLEHPARPASLAAAPLRGCTAVAVLDRAAVALAHVWEEPDMHMASPVRFRLAVLNRLRAALTGRWGQAGGRTTAFVITPTMPWEIDGFPTGLRGLLYAAQVERIKEMVKETVPSVREVVVVPYDPERNILGMGRQQTGGTQVLLQYAPDYFKDGRRMRVVRLWFERRLLYEDVWESPPR